MYGDIQGFCWNSTGNFSRPYIARLHAAGFCRVSYTVNLMVFEVLSGLCSGLGLH